MIDLRNESEGSSYRYMRTKTGKKQCGNLLAISEVRSTPKMCVKNDSKLAIVS